MLQSILFFILGFLCSGFLALMVAPAIWRRAVALTRKRIEASVPLSLPEIQADKDRMRAELAMTIRRLEMSVKSLREKSAAQAVELGRRSEELKRLVGEMDERGQGLSRSEAKAAELDAEIVGLRQRQTELAGTVAEVEKALAAKSADLDRLGKLHEEASFVASSRQIELVARQSEVETLSGAVAELTAGRQEAERRQQELIAENRGNRDALKEETRRADLLEQANARLQASLEEREKQLASLREKLNGGTSGKQPEGPPSGAQTAGAAARSGGDMPEVPGQAGGGHAPVSAPDPSAERERLQGRLAAMAAHHGGLDRAVATASGAAADGRHQDMLLREQMSDLAAEVIRLTAKLDGPDSPIARALSAPAKPGGPGGEDRITSLADRVRALQRQAAPQ